MKMLKMLKMLMVVMLVAGQVLPAQAATLKKNSVVATSKDALSRFVDIMIAKDEAAARKLVEAGLIAVIPAATDVDVVSGGMFAGIYEVRPRGQVGTVWVLREDVY